MTNHPLIDLTDRIGGGIEMPQVCRCPAGERSDYEACRECEDGSMSVDGGEQ